MTLVGVGVVAAAIAVLALELELGGSNSEICPNITEDNVYQSRLDVYFAIPLLPFTQDVGRLLEDLVVDRYNKTYGCKRIMLNSTLRCDSENECCDVVPTDSGPRLHCEFETFSHCCVGCWESEPLFWDNSTGVVDSNATEYRYLQNQPQVIEWEEDFGCFKLSDASSQACLYVPENKPSEEPTLSPTNQPTGPTRSPTSRPTDPPTNQPTSPPPDLPSLSPSNQPTGPTRSPTSRPTDPPTNQPTRPPTSQPTYQPTTPPPTNQQPNGPTRPPINQPNGPTRSPTSQPSDPPTRSPTRVPAIKQPTVPFRKRLPGDDEEEAEPEDYLPVAYNWTFPLFSPLNLFSIFSH
jgi:hypothetical protein